MNIFFLDRDPIIAATHHCDKHVVKMILETAQLLSTAHHVLGTENTEMIYRKTHVNHPSAIWVRQSKENYLWAFKLLVALCEEYTYRYGRIHATESRGVVNALEDPPINIPDISFTDPPQCMPDEYKDPLDPVESYRRYYVGSKSYMAKWKMNKPEWWRDASPRLCVSNTGMMVNEGAKS
jgi:hypothetical protein